MSLLSTVHLLVFLYLYNLRTIEWFVIRIIRWRFIMRFFGRSDLGLGFIRGSLRLVEPFGWRLSPLSSMGPRCPEGLGLVMKRHRTCRILLPQITILLLLCRQNLCLFSWRLQPKGLSSFSWFSELKIENLLQRKTEKLNFAFLSSHGGIMLSSSGWCLFFAFFSKIGFQSSQDLVSIVFIVEISDKIFAFLLLLSIHEFFCWLHRWFILCFYRASLPLCAFSEGRILLFLVRLERNGIISRLSFEGFCRKLRYHCLLLSITVFLRRCC